MVWSNSLVKMRFTLYLIVALGLCDAVTYGTCLVSVQEIIKSDANNCSVSIFKRSFQNVLIRNKRWFVFPNGANVLLTMVVTKTILDGRPRGLQESLEMEMAFSVPPWVEGWQVPSLSKSDSNSVKSALNPISFNTNKSIVAAQPKIDIDFGNSTWKYHYSNNQSKEKLLGHHRRQYSEISAPFHQYPTPFSRRYKENIKPRLHHSQYHREYRERRQIFEKLEGLNKYLGIHIRSCIKRAICEVKNDLMPEGESFIQDVARIVFTIPLDNDYDSTSTGKTNCARKFSVTCPFSPLEYFLRSGPKAPADWDTIKLS